MANTPFLARQGDLLIRRIDKLPQKDVRPEGSNILLRGEATGHAHRVSKDAQVYMLERSQEVSNTDRANGNDLIFAYVNVPKGESILEHEEHNNIKLEEGVYEIRRQREFIGGLTRLVGD